jgi:hypothetical protein
MGGGGIPRELHFGLWRTVPVPCRTGYGSQTLTVNSLIEPPTATCKVAVMRRYTILPSSILQTDAHWQHILEATALLWRKVAQ